MAYFPGNDRRRRWISSQQGLRCELYHLFGQCRAVNAKCFLCLQSRHFRKVCKNNATQLKHTKTKERDTERMTAFIRKKTAESLPFSSNLTNEELFKMFSEKSLSSMRLIKNNCKRYTCQLLTSKRN